MRQYLLNVILIFALISMGIALAFDVSNKQDLNDCKTRNQAVLSELAQDTVMSHHERILRYRLTNQALDACGEK